MSAFAALEQLRDAHLVFHRGMLVFGRSVDGRYLHIDAPEVRNGISCECACPHPKCGGRLVAKNRGTVTEHHFAHANGHDCGERGETLLHRLAKEVLARDRETLVPEGKLNDTWRTDLLFPAQVVRFDDAMIEPRLGNYRPDILLTQGQRSLFIEVVVGSKASAEKRAHYRSLHVSVLEIHLGLFREISLTAGTLRSLLRTGGSRSWLANQIIDAARLRFRHRAGPLVDRLGAHDESVRCPAGAGRILVLGGDRHTRAVRGDCARCAYHGWDEPGVVCCGFKSRVRSWQDVEAGGGNSLVGPDALVWSPDANVDRCPICNSKLIDGWWSGMTVCPRECVRVLR